MPTGLFCVSEHPTKLPSPPRTHSTPQSLLAVIVQFFKAGLLPQSTSPHHPSASVSIRQYTSAYVSIPASLDEHTGAGAAIYRAPVQRAERTFSEPNAVALLAAYVSIRQHTSAYVSIRQHTSAHVQ
jgi:hypothetical protein